MDSKCLALLLALGAAVHASNPHYQYGGYQHPTPVDGGWSHYGDYSDCSVTCGKGIKTRTRVCNNPAPAHGGAYCRGSDKETKVCDAGHCPVDGGWSDYGEYSACDVTCGKGHKTRTRKCNNPAPAYGGADCYGDETETKKCDAGHCPVDGGWSDYGEYSACDVTCGEGHKTRTRKCNNPAPAYGGADCYGDETETKKCNAGYCPIHGGWTSWGDYSDCSAKCGSGVQTRTRTCTNPPPAYGGDDCTGDHEETKECYAGYRCPVHGGWSAWDSWTPCSKSCGGGVKTRARRCDNPSPRYGGNSCYGEAEQSRECNKHACPRPYYY